MVSGKVEVEVLEVSQVHKVEGHEDGDDLTLAEASLSSPCSWCWYLVRLEMGQCFLAEVVDVAEQMQ